jgi:hypothetical protein
LYGFFAVASQSYMNFESDQATLPKSLKRPPLQIDSVVVIQREFVAGVGRPDPRFFLARDRNKGRFHAG